MLYFRQNEHFLKSHDLFLSRVSTPGGSALCALPHTESRAVTRPEDNGSFMCETRPDAVQELMEPEFRSAINRNWNPDILQCPAP